MGKAASFFKTTTRAEKEKAKVTQAMFWMVVIGVLVGFLVACITKHHA
jgi:uncharacterized membrane protein YwzB